ncbi:GNAT family N-acetyltransferase [Niveispirillum fermenti]|uniref:GNAT family N-acetyltransferase n=1 Tax=Niveispirillum fermenti TaxID=1233113 RepID=UPI003A878442
MTDTPSLPPPGHLKVTVTYLEMTARPVRRQRPHPHERLSLLRAENCTLSFYRYLYDTVGEEWLWWFRRALPATELRTILADTRVEIYVAHVAGVPAGYVELDRRTPGCCEIQYLGLVPEFIGMRIGPWLLDWAIEAAWNGAGVEKVTVNTCDLDHPRALMTYQKAGFHPVRQEVRFDPDPRLAGLIRRDAAPHITLPDQPLLAPGKTRTE